MRLLVALLCLIPLCAQPPADGKGPRRPPPEPKNLKVLKIAPSEIIPTMFTYRVGLGVQCSHCHVQGEWDKDDKPTKETARKMIVMTQEINAKFPDGKIHVTCFTCHRGETEPKTAPPPKPPADKPADGK